MIGSWSNQIIDESRCHMRDRHTLDTPNPDVNYVTLGLAGLADHSHRPAYQPRQLDAEIEALICQLRGGHPRWGPRRAVVRAGQSRREPAAVEVHGLPGAGPPWPGPGP